MGEGECSAVIADAADGPELADAMDCGRAVDMPETGSVLDAGHSPRGPFFRAAQLDASPAGAGPTPFVCDEDDDIVGADEAVEASDDEELARWMLLRGMNIWR